jgi:SSS family transporter
MGVATRLSPLDLALVGLYLVGITAFGLRFSKGKSQADKSLKSYFLADNAIPWWAIALSIVSAETSTLTIVSIPGVAFAGDLGFLQVVIGYMLGRVVVAMLFLPLYFQGKMLTAYQLIDQRFGATLHKVTAGLFLATRAAAEGVRVFAISIVVGVAIGTGDVLSIAIISALTLLYTFEGGMAAVIWTDVVQMALYVGGTVVALITLGHLVPGGWTQIHALAVPAGKLHMFNFAFNLTQSYTFWAGVLGGTFLTMASHGTDQLMVQRMLAARSLKESRLALLSSGVVIFVQFTLFLLIGVGLWVFYGMRPGTSFRTNDYIFPTFIVHQMPRGIAGLLVAAILAAAMSNLSAALNSLSSTTVVDFYMHLRPHAAGRERSLVSRASTVVWALVLFAIAVYSVQAGGKGHVVETGLSIASVAYGALLGVFLLGTLTRYASQTGAIVGMVCGFGFNLWLWKGMFPVTIAGMAIPKIAFTWYVILGAGVTFGVGSLASLVWKRGRAVVVAGLVLLCAAGFAGAQTHVSEVRHGAPSSVAAPAAPDFGGVSKVIEAAIAEKKLPGAVVLLGHGGKVVFEQAYGVRKLAGEPGLDGKPSPAEPMTEDTIFDMASLTKVMATSVAVMQLVEQGKVGLDTPVAKYLPEFAQNGKGGITVRELLTHYSGLPPDVSLKDAWGLAKPDKAEGIRRAMASGVDSVPGTKFVYSDINFITLGYLVERVSGKDLDVYAQQHIFKPLAMADTRYFRFYKGCGVITLGAAIVGDREQYACPPETWHAEGYRDNIAPTAHDNEGTPETNPDFDHLLRGTVHDPTTRRMGGVAGHAGVFSTAHDLSLYAQALLDKLLFNTGPFPLLQKTLQTMTTPQQPATAQGGATIFTQDGQAAKGVARRGLGWDIDSAFSRPRGTVFPIGSFGHTGFTGTSVWFDPGSDTFVILLANAIHPRGNPPISPLRGEVATAVGKALGICAPTATCDDGVDYGHMPEAEGQAAVAPAEGSSQGLKPGPISEATATTSRPCPATAFCDSFGAPTPYLSPVALRLKRAMAMRTIPDFDCSSGCSLGDRSGNSLLVEGAPARPTLTGIDVLEATNFAALHDAAVRHGGKLRIGLVTNQSGVDAKGKRTVDVLLNSLPEVTLVKLFSPEHGLYGQQDTEHMVKESDPVTKLPVVSLYGPKPSDRHPKAEDLEGLDAVVIDLQDAGVRFWTYETLMGYFLEAGAESQVEVFVLDRPNPIGGVAAQGPMSEVGMESYNDFMPIPVRHGLTMGELARYFNDVPLDASALLARYAAVGDETMNLAMRPGIHAPLTVVPMQGWKRGEYYDDTGVPWINPSPNLRSPRANVLYPALGLIDQTNISIGRGTDTPFEHLGAPWIDGVKLAAYLNARKIAGVEITATTFTVSPAEIHLPFHGQAISGVAFRVTDRNAFDSPELGVELLAALHKLYPEQFQLARAKTLVANSAVMEAIMRGADPKAMAAGWAAADAAFRERAKQYLLYP